MMAATTIEGGSTAITSHGLANRTGEDADPAIGDDTEWNDRLRVIETAGSNSDRCAVTNCWTLSGG